MKQLKKLVLHKTTPLTAPQMKHITGGYDGSGYDDLCEEDQTKYLCTASCYELTSTGYCCGTEIDCVKEVKKLYTDAGISDSDVHASCTVA